MASGERGRAAGTPAAGPWAANVDTEKEGFV
jgi:hypothetical protein